MQNSNEDYDLNKFQKLKEATDEYQLLNHQEKKEYMRVLTQWYMRQKDMLSYNETHNSI